MNIQIFGSPKSFDSKKAERWFKERRIKYQYIDLKSKGLSPREYQAVRRCVPFEELVDTKCRAYEELYMAYITPAAREEAFAVAIDDDFRLVVEYPDGRRAALSAGEVSVRGMYGYV